MNCGYYNIPQKKLNERVTKFSTYFDKKENLIGDINEVEELRKDIIDEALTIATNLNYMEYE